MSASKTIPAPVPLAHIEARILIIRGQKVMIDADLAQLYGVPTKALNQAIKRNAQRFPPDFMFTLTAQEKAEVVTNCDHLARLRFSRTLPFAFTEHGAIMAASVLNTPRAIETSVYVVRAFVKLREMILTHRDIADKIEKLERNQKEYSEVLVALQSMIKHLFDYSSKASTPIGFRKNGKG